ncbi:hypothetical protein GCM10023177_73450 [Streptomyces violaceoruber]
MDAGARGIADGAGSKAAGLAPADSADAGVSATEAGEGRAKSEAKRS